MTTIPGILWRARLRGEEISVRSRRRFAALCLVVLFCAYASAEEPKKFDVAGWGGLPLSDSVTSLWLNGPNEGARPQPLLMVYFRGQPGWHKRDWKINSQFGK